MYNNYKLCIQIGGSGNGIINIEESQSDMNVVEAECNFYNSGTAGRLGNQIPITMQGSWSAQFALFKATYKSNGQYDPTRPFRIFYFTITEVDKLVGNFLPALDSQGVPSMYNFVTKTPFYNSGGGQFIVGMTLSQSLKLATLPATGGTLTISLPTGYDSDSGVMSALETARANGWTLTIQTYTPEAAASSAATFALRRIWVRRTQAEHGLYVAADGTRWQVDWCVDMLTPDGSTPDAHGYELFRSQEAAVAYWELSPYVDPESENLLTE